MNVKPRSVEVYSEVETPITRVGSVPRMPRVFSALNAFRPANTKTTSTELVILPAEDAVIVVTRKPGNSFLIAQYINRTIPRLLYFYAQAAMSNALRSSYFEVASKRMIKFSLHVHVLNHLRQIFSVNK